MRFPPQQYAVEALAILTLLSNRGFVGQAPRDRRRRFQKYPGSEVAVSGCGAARFPEAERSVYSDFDWLAELLDQPFLQGGSGHR